MSYRSKENFIAKYKEAEKFLADIEIELANEKYWQELLKRKRGFLGKWTMEYAEYLARLVQWHMAQGNSFNQAMNKVALSAMSDDVPVSLYGRAISVLIDCWKYGPEIQRQREAERSFD
jgi:hypothetical protein